jgi:hypothetical protein
VTYPTIHPNGTNGKALSNAYEAAYEAIGHARDVLKQSAPNPRAYYPQGPEAFETAVSDHTGRLKALVDMMDELDELVGHCGREGGGL